MYCRISYGRPLINRCPLSPLPDVGFVTLETNGFIEVLAWRRMVNSFQGRKAFAEDLTKDILAATRQMAPGVSVRITYRRLFGRMEVRDGDSV